MKRITAWILEFLCCHPLLVAIYWRYVLRRLSPSRCAHLSQMIHAALVAAALRSE